MTMRDRIVMLEQHDSVEENADEALLLPASMEIESADDARDTEWMADDDAYVSNKSSYLAPAPRDLGWVLPVLAAAAVGLWTAYFIWAHRHLAIEFATPATWITLIDNWAPPVLLLFAGFLLFTRSSHRETARFAGVARSLSTESAQLEKRLTSVNHELSLARNFLESQTRDLDTLARLATDRLSQQAEQLQSLIHINSEKVETLGAVSAAALENLEKLRGQLPVITTSTRDVTNNIGNAGRTAHGHLQDMILGFTRLNEFGQVSERQVLSLRTVVDETMGALSTHTEKLEGSASQGFATLKSSASDFQAQVEQQEQSLAQLQLTGDAIAEKFTNFQQLISDLTVQGNQTTQGLLEGVKQLDGKIAESRTTLTGTQTKITEMTDAGVRLLELLIASAEQGGKALPDALAKSTAQLEEIERRVFAMRDAAQQAGENGSALQGRMAETIQSITEAKTGLDALYQSSSSSAETQASELSTLRDSLAEIEQVNARLADSARETVAHFERLGGEAAQNFASQITATSAQAIDAVARERTQAISAELEAAADRATSVSREAAIQLRDQLAKVAELSSNLERRVAQARERAEETINDDFSRRVALITESLNSNAIDIARALDSEVSDTAWSAYLKGDRGIFARRTVSLLSSAESKSIVQLYENDRDFHDHVSRYIHDFEFMLRQILSTREGNAMGVTLLSSDMGKIYVALAQAIERLRN